MKYIYSLYDAKTGELAYKGKAGQLVADGIFSRSDDVSRLWAKQHLKGIRARKWKVEREEIRPVAKKIAPPGGTTRKVCWDIPIVPVIIRKVWKGLCFF